MPTSPAIFNARINSLLRKIHCLEDSLLAVLLFGMILLATSQIFLRNVFESGIVWADPLLRVAVLWLGLLGALAATRDNKHINIDLLTRYLSPLVRDGVKSLSSLFAAVITAVLAYHSLRFVLMEFESQSKVFLDIPAWVMELIMPIAFALISLRFLIHCVLNLREAFRRQSQA